MKFRSPRGTHDILPGQAEIFRRVTESSREIFERYGYQELVTPIFEESELFTRSVGTETDIVKKEMYIFTDRGGRTLALRPEGTASVVRAYLQHGLHAKGDVQKIYYSGPMFRYDRPSSGRYRQFHQVGVEAVGSLSPFLDVEAIVILRELALGLGISDVEVRLNSVGCKKCRPGYVSALKSFLSDKLDSLCGDCKTRYDVNPLRILDCKVESCRSSLEGIPLQRDHLCGECGDHFNEVKTIMDTSNISYTLDPYLVRGLDYYTKTAFELYYELFGAQNSLGGGGRYDDLVEMLGGSPTPAVGFSAGVERLMLVYEMIQKQQKEGGQDVEGAGGIDVFFVAIGEASRAAAFREMMKVRRRLSADMDFSDRSVKAQFRRANKMGAALAVIVGEDELEKEMVRVKDMVRGEESDVPLAELTERLIEMKVRHNE
jgi:histidyl-tRNA synthetase